LRAATSAASSSPSASAGPPPAPPAPAPALSTGAALCEPCTKACCCCQCYAAAVVVHGVLDATSAQRYGSLPVTHLVCAMLHPITSLEAPMGVRLHHPVGSQPGCAPPAASPPPSSRGTGVRWLLVRLAPQMGSALHHPAGAGGPVAGACKASTSLHFSSRALHVEIGMGGCLYCNGKPFALLRGPWHHIGLDRRLSEHAARALVSWH
jgi:hypothetical protein